MTVQAIEIKRATHGDDVVCTELTNIILAARFRGAEKEPQTFVDRLDWSVSDDLSVLSPFAKSCSRAAPFQSREWFSAWLETLGSKAQLRILIGRAEGCPVVAMPLSIEKAGPFQRLSYAAQEVSDYNHPLLHRLLEPHANSALMSALYRKAGELIPQADILYFRKLLEQPELRRDRMFGQSSRAEADATHWVELSGQSWEDAKGRFFGKSGRRALARKEKKISPEVPLRFSLLKQCDERVEAMRLLTRWKGKQLATLGLANPFHNSGLAEFFVEMVRRGDPLHYRIYQLASGDEPIALSLLICTNGRWFHYQTAYTDQEAGRYSPGLILLRELLREAHEQQAKLFDFGLGNESYKQKYCNRHANLYRYQVPLNAFGVMAMLCSDMKFAVRSALKSPGLLRSGTLKTLCVISRASDRFWRKSSATRAC